MIEEEEEIDRVYHVTCNKNNKDTITCQINYIVETIEGDTSTIKEMDIDQLLLSDVLDVYEDKYKCMYHIHSNSTCILKIQDSLKKLICE